MSAILFGYQSFSLSGHIGSDFMIFYDTVQRVLTDPDLIYASDKGMMETARSLDGFLYPPPSVVLLLPFGLVDAQTGFALFVTAATACGAISLSIWLDLATRQRVIGPTRAARLMLIMLAMVSGPVFTCRAGQVDTLILLIITSGLLLIDRNRHSWGAAALAAGAWIKIYPALILLAFTADQDRRLRLATGFAGAGFIIVASASLFFSIDVWISYFRDMLPVMSKHAIINIDNQSLTADVLRWGMAPEHAMTSFDSVEIPTWLRLAVMLGGLATIIASLFMARRVGAPTLWTAATACAVISLIAPLGWSHSYAYALPLFVLVTARAIEQPQRVVRAFIASCWIALIIPAHRHFAFLNDLPILWHLTYSRYALATLGMIGLGWHRMITMPVVATKKSCPSHKGRAASIDQC